jgi:diguanylate cyclase (GGDEF)-like protein
MTGITIIAVSTATLSAVLSGILVTRALLKRSAYLRDLQERSQIITRLLSFSQTIQGAGRADQIYPTLGHYLRTELDLAGMAILTHEADAVPDVQVQMKWPEDLLNRSPVEFDAALCPCLRQNLPWKFEPGGSPMRCMVDASLRLGPEHAAYCIPFTFARRVQVAAHMLLKPGNVWTEHRQELAQAYVNTAQAALTALQLLHDAEKQSMTDGLTGLYNRRSLDQLLLREVALAERYDHALSVVMVDLDCFKSVNDTHGHAAGDHVLRAFADCVRMTLRKTDLAFRYGGDEFVIALPQTTVQQAHQVMQKLRQAFLAVDFSHAISHMGTQPTLSMGMAERCTSAKIVSMPEMLSAADQALYAAKSGTRNCIQIFEPPKAA